GPRGAPSEQQSSASSKAGTTGPGFTPRFSTQPPALRGGLLSSERSSLIVPFKSVRQSGATSTRQTIGFGRYRIQTYSPGWKPSARISADVVGRNSTVATRSHTGHVSDGSFRVRS